MKRETAVAATEEMNVMTTVRKVRAHPESCRMMQRTARITDLITRISLKSVLRVRMTRTRVKGLSPTVSPRVMVRRREITDIADTIRKMEGNRKTMTINLKENERLDDLQRNGYQIIQNPEKFCFGMDAVLLSGFARAKESDICLDMGTGTGIIPLLMEGKYHCARLTGLEIQEESADMARRSVALNGLSDKIQIITGDIKEADRIFKSASFDCITCNPPYMIGQHGITNPDAPKAIARHEILCTLEDVVSQAAKLLKPGGRFYLVHRPFRLAEIITSLTSHKLEPKRMQLVYPYVDKEPNMVLIEAVRGGRSRMTVEKPLIVYEKPGVYTPEIYDIYGY